MEQGVIKSEIIMGSDDQLHHLQTQPTEDLILNRNAELRKNPGVIHDLGAQGSGGTWGRQVASIPEIMYYAAIKNGYQLNSKDKDTASKDMFRFLQTEEGKKCLVRDSV